ncbi:dehydratase [Solihabitans fulvus]|uniref:Dehydratase n=1 Tax=Solihabitans fulvus TaxID=1892852 RepID=A0A5B2WQL9_9PSEU|nr:dehydratase [Solihabitans fulvus]KAA2252826.1 dehydratase [Solihabitans fulvus]
MSEATLTATRTVTDADIDACAELTGDFGAHHTTGVAEGRMAQGLLTLAATPLLADPGVHLAELSMVFLAPVFAGDTVTSVVEIVGTTKKDDGLVSLAFTLSIASDRGVEVLRGEGTATARAGQLPW